MIWLFLTACDMEPYEDYYEDPSAFPAIKGVTPRSTDSLRGGEQVTISGERLDGAATVLFGGRNAEIVSVTASEVVVTLPDYVAGGGAVDVSVVTPKGYATGKSLFSYAAPGSGWMASEEGSVGVARLDCPVEGWGQYNGAGGFEVEDTTIFWCGVEGGFADAYAFLGAAPQRGAAGDMMGYAELSALPPVGETVVYGPGDPRPPLPALLYGSHAANERIDLVTEQDFTRDLAWVEQRIDELPDQYSSYALARSKPGIENVTAEPWIVFFDEDSCETNRVAWTGATTDALTAEGGVGSGAAGAWLGLRVFDTVYNETVDGVTGTAFLSNLQAEGEDGVGLLYDDYSGYFFYDGVAEILGSSDVAFSEGHGVVHTVLGASERLGTVQSVDELVLVTPDPMFEAVDLDPGEDFVVEWEPGTDGADPSYVVVDLRIYDYDIADPSWYTEVARLVAHGDDSTGTVTIPAEALAQLPTAKNLLNFDYDTVAYWGDLTIARHQLRRVPFGDGHLVIDFMHAVNSPFYLRTDDDRVDDEGDTGDAAGMPAPPDVVPPTRARKSAPKRVKWPGRAPG